MSKTHPGIAAGLLLAILAIQVRAEETLEEIIVTAQRREQSAQDIPISVTAFTTKSLEESGFRNPVELAHQTPGLNANGSIGDSNPIFTIRGVGLNDTFSNNNPSASVYLDEVLVPFNPMLSFQLYDLQRVEVLKGPQGTLYGRNTTGGAINFITQKPSNETDGYVMADYSRFDRKQVEGAIGGKLSDTLSGRLSAMTVQQNGGWQTDELTGNKIGDVDEISARGQLQWTPDERTKALLRLEWSTDKSDNQLRQHIGSYTAPFGFTPCQAVITGGRDEGPCVDFLGYYDPSTDPRTVANSALYGYRRDSRSYGGSLSFSHTFDQFTFTSISGFSYFNRVMGDDSDGGALIELDSRFTDDIHAFTQEFRLSSPQASPLRWVAGAYYSDDTIKGDILQALDQHIFKTRVDTNWTQGTKSYAGFGQIEIPLAERWRLTTGIRYTNEKKSIRYDSKDLNPFGTSQFLPTPVAGIDNSITSNNVSGKVGLDFHAAEHLLLYGSASKGFKSGGFKAAIAFNPAELDPFKPETIYAYELGAKSDLLEGHVRINGAVYYYDWRNFQAFITENREGINVVVLSNAGDAKVKGAELEFSWLPISGLSINLGGNLMQTKIVKYDTLPGTSDNTGHELANSPRRTLNSSIRYELPVMGDEVHAFVLGSVNYQSAQFFSVTNNPQAAQSGFALLDARVGLIGNHDRWEVSIWGKNLADKLYITQAYDNYPGIFPSSDFLGNPRTFGITAQLRFH